MKYIVLAFDDGRKDQYTNAVRIMRKYGLVGSIYITTGFVDGTLNRNSVFLSSGGRAMEIADIRDCIEKGIEVGAHADMHTNEITDIETSVQKLHEWCEGLENTNTQLGFASPSSDIYAGNIASLKPLRKKLKYIRTGVQIRRNGLVYSGLFVLNNILKSKRLFWRLNRRYINKPDKNFYLAESVAVRSDTPKNHILYTAENIRDGECLCLLFHSILSDKEREQKVDCWYYDIEQFEELCQYFSGNHNYEILTMADAVDRLRKAGE